VSTIATPCGGSASDAISSTNWLAALTLFPRFNISGSLAMLDATRLASSIVICFAAMASSSVERPQTCATANPFASRTT
jgi:hypothetical protein